MRGGGIGTATDAQSFSISSYSMSFCGVVKASLVVHKTAEIRLETPTYTVLVPGTVMLLIRDVTEAR